MHNIPGTLQSARLPHSEGMKTLVVPQTLRTPSIRILYGALTRAFFVAFSNVESLTSKNSKFFLTPAKINCIIRQSYYIFEYSVVYRKSLLL